ncbi:unnamed protein product, partial [Onchocerca ochengi]|uniref:2-phosphosulfolactate phosphatase n=1 Tax=Onchocerca ochengi TaxID=42157 RepID=A0A182EY29_ONCOC
MIVLRSVCSILATDIGESVVDGNSADELMVSTLV